MKFRVSLAAAASALLLAACSASDRAYESSPAMAPPPEAMKMADAPMEEAVAAEGGEAAPETAGAVTLAGDTIADDDTDPRFGLVEGAPVR